MTAPLEPTRPADRDRAKARLRLLTRGAIVTAAGATVVMGVVVSHDHPGANASTTTKDTNSSSSTDGATGGSSSSETTSGSSDTGTTGNTGNTGNTGDTGNTGTSSSVPTTTNSSPVVSSGATATARP